MGQVTPEMELILALSGLQSQIQKRIDSHLYTHGISFTEFQVMHRLYAAPGRTLRRIDLAEAIGLSASGVTRLLLPMEKIKLVEKQANPRDARVSLVKLSGTGQQVFEDAMVSFQQSAKDLCQNLDGKQIPGFLALIQKLK